jgi:hypothetical protein
MFKFFTIIAVGIYLVVFYLGFYVMLGDIRYPILRDRFGTILTHSSDPIPNAKSLTDRREHLYCYYPSSQAQYKNKAGEFILMRAANIEDCQDFYGMASFKESPWVSEREKIWWSKSNKLEDELVNTDNEIKLL